jgi:hypothetical protein
MDRSSCAPPKRRARHRTTPADLPGREGTCLPIVVPLAPTLSRIGQLIGLTLLLVVAGIGLRRRQRRGSSPS